MKKCPTGWRNEPSRHSLAARGFQTRHIRTRGILLIRNEPDRNEPEIPYVFGVGYNRVKYLVGRITETKDLVEYGGLENENIEEVVGYLIDEIKGSSSYMGAVARDEKYKMDVENIMYALEDYSESGILHGEVPKRDEVINHLIALLYVFKKAMGV